MPTELVACFYGTDVAQAWWAVEDAKGTSTRQQLALNKASSTLDVVRLKIGSLEEEKCPSHHDVSLSIDARCELESNALSLELSLAALRQKYQSLELELFEQISAHETALAAHNKVYAEKLGIEQMV